MDTTGKTDFERMLEEPTETLAKLANTTWRNDEEKQLIEMAQAILAMGDNETEQFFLPQTTAPDITCFEYVKSLPIHTINELYINSTHRKGECSISMMLVAMGEN